MEKVLFSAPEDFSISQLKLLEAQRCSQSIFETCVETAEKLVSAKMEEVAENILDTGSTANNRASATVDCYPEEMKENILDTGSSATVDCYPEEMTDNILDTGSTAKVDCYPEEMAENILDTGSTLQVLVRDDSDEVASEYYTETDEKKQLDFPETENPSLTNFPTVLYSCRDESGACAGTRIIFQMDAGEKEELTSTMPANAMIKAENTKTTMNTKLTNVLLKNARSSEKKIKSESKGSTKRVKQTTNLYQNTLSCQTGPGQENKTAHKVNFKLLFILILASMIQDGVNSTGHLRETASTVPIKRWQAFKCACVSQESNSINVYQTDSFQIPATCRSSYVKTKLSWPVIYVFNTIPAVLLFKQQIPKVMASFLIGFSSISAATSTPVYDNGHKCLRLVPTLPDECWEHFDDARNCPEKGIDADEISTLTLKCCKDFPDTVIHCSKPECDSPDNHAPLIIACIKDTIIKSGYFMKITSSGGFTVISQDTCSEGSYEPADRNSSEAHYPYCTFTKTTCLATEGQTKACDGGPTRDNQCGCLEDFINSCERTFTENDAACKCTRNKCPPGFTRKVFISDSNQSCPEKYLPVNNTCISAQVQTPETYDQDLPIITLSTTKATMSSSPVKTTEAVTYLPNADDDTQNNTGKIIGITVGITILITCIVIVIIRKIYRNMYKLKKNVNITAVRYTEIQRAEVLTPEGVGTSERENTRSQNLSTEIP